MNALLATLTTILPPLSRLLPYWVDSERDEERRRTLEREMLLAVERAASDERARREITGP